MIVLFTDFGIEDPYVGQLHGVLAQRAPGVPVVDLFHSVPNFDIRAAAYLLPAYAAEFPPGTIFLCVVDPGVGTARRPLMLAVDGCWYVGPDNGLFHILVRRAHSARCYTINWRPAQLSPSFHGRDLFAPVVAMLARGEQPDSGPTKLGLPHGPEWPDDLARVLYIDHYGNIITGVRAGGLDKDAIIKAGDHEIAYARVFADAVADRPFWHENANGLVEIAIN
ncbi:MAG: S-adenosyl-l-methionine hydroxide adenosyltransferase family protein, partial [Acidiferrobacterales bacterium]